MTRRAMVVTGGIGAGKSALVGALGGAGFETVDADLIGRRLLESGSDVVEEVGRRWPDVVLSDGSVDRPALAQIVFTDPEELAALEAMTHPAIRRELEARLEAEGPPLVIDLSVPRVISVDGGLAGLPVVVVDAPMELRRARLAARGLEADDVGRRLAAQPSRGEWLQLADIVVPNHGDLAALARAAVLVRAWFGSRTS